MITYQEEPKAKLSLRPAYFHIIPLLLLILAPAGLSAQQMPLYSQYIQNGFLVNPSMAGEDGYTSFNTTVRQQWLGFTDAPQTYSASWQTRLLRRSYRIVNHPVRRSNMLMPSTKGRVGLGAYIINDVNGNVARTGISFTYAYHIIMNNRQLSFGLAPKFFQYRLYDQNLSLGDARDPVFSGNFHSVAYCPDADFGVHFRGYDYFVGFAVSNLLQTAVVLGSGDQPDFKSFRHYWLMGGYKFALTNEFFMEPGLLLKTSENWNPQGDLSLKFYYEDQFWAGLSYRTNGSLIAMFGVRIEGLYLGYSFDYTLSKIGSYSFGSHEITMSVKLGSNARRYKWLNRY
ncbi:MAG: type IX secretion system membrane protein PorP/SprF [Bacteroidales bacterium]|nr:type IX secretion system membrane protein PorP/SprF [Bacteroidales bacterium]MBN2698022.1 type IX secretion system membrane protein PorP/SprF [Bacteroidales bacterium]